MKYVKLPCRQLGNEYIMKYLKFSTLIVRSITKNRWTNNKETSPHRDASKCFIYKRNSFSISPNYKIAKVLKRVEVPKLANTTKTAQPMELAYKCGYLERVSWLLLIKKQKEHPRQPGSH